MKRIYAMLAGAALLLIAAPASAQFAPPEKYKLRVVLENAKGGAIVTKSADCKWDDWCAVEIPNQLLGGSERIIRFQTRGALANHLAYDWMFARSDAPPHLKRSIREDVTFRQKTTGVIELNDTLDGVWWPGKGGVKTKPLLARLRFEATY